MRNKEQVYDDEINPLMAHIIAICKEHRIAMVASFDLPIEEDPDLRCTTAILGEECEPSDDLLRALQCVYAQPTPVMRLTTRDADGNVVAEEVILP